MPKNAFKAVSKILTQKQQQKLVMLLVIKFLIELRKSQEAQHR